MYMYRQYGCKGILKYFCPRCGCHFYVSFFGRDYGMGNHDYMYDAFKQLLSSNTIVSAIDRCYITPDSSWQEGSYEFDNDYEKYNIMHLISQQETDRPQDSFYYRYGTFVKGVNFDLYASVLFPTDRRGSCIYCGYPNTIYSNMSCTTQNFIDMDITVKTQKPAFTQRADDTVQYFNKQPFPHMKPVKDPEKIVKDYLSPLVKVESNIVLVTKRLTRLYEEYWRYTLPFYENYIRKGFPDSSGIPELPETPKLAPVPLLFGAKVKARNDALMAEYKKKELETRRGVAVFFQGRDQFLKGCGARREQIQELFRNGEFEQINTRRSPLLPQNAPVLLEKAKVVFSEIGDCQQHLGTLIKERNQLHSMEVVYGKFLDFPAITTILEYLEIGRCETLKGPCGAYNLYESELRSNAIISKLDQIVDSLEQIKSNQYKIYQVLSSIENETSALSDSMNQMLERMDDYGENLDQIRRSSEATAYYSQKAACYSEITAVESTTLAFLAMYNSN